MAWTDDQVALLGKKPDSVVAREVGKSRQAVAHERKRRDIAPFPNAHTVGMAAHRAKRQPKAASAPAPRAPPAPPPAPPRDPPTLESVTEDRVEFLRDTIHTLQTSADPMLPGFASAHNLAAKLHAELLAELKARKPPATKRTPEQWKEATKREAPNWPDPILEIVVEVYCDRHGYVLTPKALRAV